MEIRAATIAFTKRKAKTNHSREKEIKRQLDELDDIICNNFQHPDMDKIWTNTPNLKMNLSQFMNRKGKQQCLDQNPDG